MIARQLREKAHLRMFYDGIEVMRQQDGGSEREKREVNQQALQSCHDLLCGGGCLFVFPEGTSSLGPSHLPFQRGAARIIRQAVDAGAAVQVIPVSIRYEAAECFQRDVEVLIGEAVPVRVGERTHVLHHRITESLELIGLNVETKNQQARLERLAYAATLGEERSYLENLLRLQRVSPLRLAEIDRGLRTQVRLHGLATHQGVPVLPHGWLLPAYLLAWLVLAPVVGLAALVNLPPMLLAAWLARRGADDRNGISPWRIAIGVPLWMIWALLIFYTCLLLGQLPCFVVWSLLTWAGLQGLYRERKLRAQLFNALFRPRAAAAVRALHTSLLKEMNDHETPHSVSSAA